jgi:hypothetical protein
MLRAQIETLADLIKSMITSSLEMTIRLSADAQRQELYTPCAASQRSHALTPERHTRTMTRCGWGMSLIVGPISSRWAGLEDETYSYAASEFLVVSVDLPAIGHVTVATPETPTLPCSWISIPGN